MSHSVITTDVPTDPSADPSTDPSTDPPSVAPRRVAGRPPRPARTIALTWAAWPAMLGLAVAAIAGVLPAPAFVVGAVAVLGALAAGLRARRAGPATATLVLVGPGLFALVGLTGPPTAGAPAPMLLNAAVLLAAAVAVLAAVVALALRPAVRPGAGYAAQAVVALAIGSAGYLVDVLARAAVVAAGAAGQQAAVEGTAWTASSYLLGLPPEATPMVLLLVLMDLLQLAYLVLGYVAVGLLARGLARAGLLSVRAGGALTAVGVGLGGVVTVCAAVAAVLPPTAGGVAAGLAFGLTIPFMSTVLPHVLGGLLLARGAGRAGVRSGHHG